MEFTAVLSNFIFEQESMLAEMKEQSNVTKKSGWGRSVGSSKMLLGYTYNWVKSVLREHVFRKLKIVLSVDFPRVAPISTASTSAEASSENIFQSTNAEPVGEYRPPKRFSLMSGRSHASSIATGSVVQESEGQRPASKSRPLRSREGAKRSATVNADDGRRKCFCKLSILSYHFLYCRRRLGAHRTTFFTQ